MDDNVHPLHNAEELQKQIARLKKGGGGGTFDGMEARVAKLEAKADSIDQRLDGIDGRLDRIEQAIVRVGDKALTKWDVAQVVFVVTAALMAAAIFGPRVLSMLPTSTP